MHHLPAALRIGGKHFTDLRGSRFEDLACTGARAARHIRAIAQHEEEIVLYSLQTGPVRFAPSRALCVPRVPARARC